MNRVSNGELLTMTDTRCQWMKSLPEVIDAPGVMGCYPSLRRLSC